MLNVFHIEVSLKDNRVQISAYERLRGEESTLRQYEEIAVSMDLVKTRCGELVDTLNSANRRGMMPPDVLSRLQEIGQVFYDELFPISVKEKLKATQAGYLRLSLDEQLVQVPWELLFDGEQFLCRRFHMGRLVKTRQTLTGTQNRKVSTPMKMLILADPKKDLKGAYVEGTKIRDAMDRHNEWVNADLRSDNITVNSIKEKMRNYDIVHFAGHADYHTEAPSESGWRLSDSTLKTGDIIKMAGTAAMPSLIFSNACQSARTEEWILKNNFEDDIFGLANAFLLSGVKHYIGTFWEILDEPGCDFALAFYKHILSGATVGESMQQARMAVSGKYGEETIVWASYVLYGDPTFNYMNLVNRKIPKDKRASIHEASAPKETGTKEEVIDFNKTSREKFNRSVIATGAGIILLAVVLLWVYPGFFIYKTSETEKKLLSLYHSGRYTEAVETCQVLQEKSPGHALSAVILGQILFQQKDLKKALFYFDRALASPSASDHEKADALMGLGRINSIKGKADQALTYYQKSAVLTPDKTGPYLSQAVLLEQKGDLALSLNMLEKAHDLSPKDFSIAAMADETKEKIAFSTDIEKQAKIDRLVRELLDNNDNTTPVPPSDGWTTVPLTVWLMDLKTVGYSLREGEDKLIASGITDQLIEKTRARIVERGILDKLMEELKIGSSKLTDQSTALSIGRLMAANVILSGRIIHGDHQKQVTLRLIETETSQIKAVVSEAFDAGRPTSEIAETLSGILVKKFKTMYPLRGKVDEVKGTELTINIGHNQGVKIGQQFKLSESDIIIEVVHVKSNKSNAKVLKSNGDIKHGLCFEII